MWCNTKQQKEEDGRKEEEGGKRKRVLGAERGVMESERELVKTKGGSIVALMSATSNQLFMIC